MRTKANFSSKRIPHQMKYETAINTLFLEIQSTNFPWNRWFFSSSIFFCTANFPDFLWFQWFYSFCCFFVQPISRIFCRVNDFTIFFAISKIFFLFFSAANFTIFPWIQWFFFVFVQPIWRFFVNSMILILYCLFSEILWSWCTLLIKAWCSD